MKYTKHNMNAYNLHLIKTDKFKTITISVVFRRKIVKEEITIRNLLKEMMINASYNYPTERDLIVATENLYDLKLQASNERIGNYAIMSFKTRFLNEIYTEEGMNEESIKFFLDLIFNPKFDSELDKCKKKIEKSLKSLKDNKIRYSLSRLLETTENMPYAYNSYGYIEDLDKITSDDLNKYYHDMIKNDLVDVYIVGDVDEVMIKNIFREYFKLTTFHKQEVSLITEELPSVRKIKEFREQDNVNQTQLAILCNIHGLTDNERRYILPVYSEMLGGSSNSILFDDVREKNSYAYYINAISKSYDNLLIIYSGIEKGNEKNVLKLIEKSLKNISKGNFDDEKFNSAKETLVSGIIANLDNPVGIINNYFAMTLSNALDGYEKIEKIKMVIREDIIGVSKKIMMHTMYILEGNDEKNNN